MSEGNLLAPKKLTLEKLAGMVDDRLKDLHIVEPEREVLETIQRILRATTAAPAIPTPEDFRNASVTKIERFKTLLLEEIHKNKRRVTTYPGEFDPALEAAVTGLGYLVVRQYNSTTLGPVEAVLEAVLTSEISEASEAGKSNVTVHMQNIPYASDEFNAANVMKAAKALEAVGWDVKIDRVIQGTVLTLESEKIAKN